MKRTSIYSALSVIILFSVVDYSCTNSNGNLNPTATTEPLWRGWNKYQIPESDSLARYGRELIEHTSYYLGPKGSVAQITNGMNCQNCHLDGGTVPWGNNYGAVASTYPKYRARSGGLETIVKRVSDCMERSLNAGKAVDSNSKEMKAIIAYIDWLGDGVPKKHKPRGSGIIEPPFLDRAADPRKGLLVFENKCQRCHGASGQGELNPDGIGYKYPPLWGPNSYNTAAGLYRLSRFAGFVINNMPFDEADYTKPVLTNEEAWDVAAFVNSQPRPVKIFKEDWPKIADKPYDHPFGPYADTFSETQHKFGPFKPIRQVKEEMTKKNAGK